MLSRLQLSATGNAHEQFEQAVEALGSKQAHKAARRAVNHTGRKAFTRVKRAGAKQVGLTQKKLIELGAIEKRRASGGGLSYEITSSGKALSLKHFKAKQFSYGVKAKPWGRTQKFHGAFINTGTWRSGVPFDDGHVYLRETTKSFPVRRRNGPAIPEEMVRGDARDAFEQVADGLGDRLAHEVGRLTDGVVS